MLLNNNQTYKGIYKV